MPQSDVPIPGPLWQMRDPGHRWDGGLPDAARRVVRAVGANRAHGMFPPVLESGPDNTLIFARHLHGQGDARMLAHALTGARFAPLLDLLTRLDSSCAAMASEYASIIEPGVLTITNADLFGPLICETFVACAASAADRSVTQFPAQFATQQWATWEAFLRRFLGRLQRDMRCSWPAEPRWRGPVVGLWTHGAETHNGRQRVLRLDLSGGASVAYKPRPASGEALFLAQGRQDSPGSVFDLLNGLPATSGEVRLPVLRCWTGTGADRFFYSWQEWIERPAQWGTLRADGRWRLRGTLLSVEQAERFWHRAGSLAAACFAFGITDMQEGNVLAGGGGAEFAWASGRGEPLLYPVDLEIYFAAVPRLYSTGLISHPAGGSHHHVGFENATRWCALEGPMEYWEQAADGTLCLRRRTQPTARQESRSVVADAAGQVGYGHYLPMMLRGMFDAWTLMCRNRRTIGDFVARASAGRFVRVLRKATSVYHGALTNRLHSAGQAPLRPADPAVRFDAAELEQLLRMDVPYFFRAADGGPLLYLEPGDPGQPAVLGTGELDAAWPPVGSVRSGGNLDLAGLGVALRDAVEYAFDDVPERVVAYERYGVRFRLRGPAQGLVSFDWPEMNRRFTYSWDDAKLRLKIDLIKVPAAASPSVPAADIKERLLRLDRADAPLRSRWAADGFTDAAARDSLRKLTEGGLVWLRAVVRVCGWPGHSLVGPDAAAAASRLLQHADGHLAFRKRCLTLMRRAAKAGDVPWREVAYVTDALRLAEGRPQRYGTKFERVGTDLVPCAIEAAAKVDERREKMGLEPLAAYAERLRERFPLTGAEAS